jgi:hypothetical protein
MNFNIHELSNGLDDLCDLEAEFSGRGDNQGLSFGVRCINELERGDDKTASFSSL